MCVEGSVLDWELGGQVPAPPPGICDIQASHSNSSNIVFLIDSTWHVVMLHEGSNLKVYWELETAYKPTAILHSVLSSLGTPLGSAGLFACGEETPASACLAGGPAPAVACPHQCLAFTSSHLCTPGLTGPPVDVLLSLCAKWIFRLKHLLMLNGPGRDSHLLSPYTLVEFLGKFHRNNTYSIMCCHSFEMRCFHQYEEKKNK